MSISENFEICKFEDIDIKDPFFNTLKRDYPEFETKWFLKCIKEGREALVYKDQNGIGIFAALKNECESILLENSILPPKSRTKITTLKIADRLQGQRLGEGLIAFILWKWLMSKNETIYITLFKEHEDLINLIERFGFVFKGINDRGECIYEKSRYYVDIKDPYKAFPFVCPHSKNVSYLPIDDYYHDTLFQYSDLARTEQERLNMAAANGITKIYISGNSRLNFTKGDILLIYRKYTGDGPRQYKSCITSYCVVDEVKEIISNGERYCSIEEFLDFIGNKSFFDEEELKNRYDNSVNLYLIKMLYLGYFGAGNNINQKILKEKGLWTDVYPTEQRLSSEQFEDILYMAKINPKDVIKG